MRNNLQQIFSVIVWEQCVFDVKIDILVKEKFSNLSLIFNCEYFFYFCYFFFCFSLYYVCLFSLSRCVLCFQVFGCMHRKPTSELLPFDPELEKTEKVKSGTI